ncbi:MAG: CPBP family intramembrane glutamic endopeptidase [Candidatus Dormibacteria bacterium]
MRELFTANVVGGIGATGSKGAYLGVLAIAAAVEEITFRGSIMGGPRSRIGAGWVVVLSSLVFALAHTLSVGGSILLLGPSLFVAGVALALTYQWTRSLHRGWSCTPPSTWSRSS